MMSELYLAREIAQGRARTDQEYQLLRNVELARREARRQRRNALRSHLTR